MPISMNITPSRRIAQSRRDFRLEIRNRLAKALERLNLIFPASDAKRTARQELKYRATPQCECGYEARKRQLLVALRQKISEKQTKVN
jgi:hypothetical protein